MSYNLNIKAIPQERQISGHCAKTTIYVGNFLLKQSLM
jgi:hypothetical protein